MDKEKILLWVLGLIRDYENDEDQIIDEFGDASKESHLKNKKYCDSLRTDIKQMLFKNEEGM